MMKKILLVFFFIFSTNTLLACTCDTPPIYSRYMTSDFIGIVEIKSTEDMPDTSQYRHYKAGLNLAKSFKGKMPDKIMVAGTQFNSNSGICEISVSVGEKWLIYLDKNDDGNYYMSYCSHPVKIQTKKGKNVTLSKEAEFNLEQLKLLNKHIPELHSNHLISLNYYKFSNFLRQFDSQSFERISTYFLIEFDEELNPLSIKIIGGFSDGTDQLIADYLKTKAHWYTGRFRPNLSKDSTLEKGTEYVIGVYQSNHIKSLQPFYLH